MILSVDTETTGTDFFHGCKPFIVTACDGTSNYIWEGKVNPYNRAEVTWDQSDIEEITDLLYEASSLIYHNSKFDIRALESIGIEYTKPLFNKTEDTMIAAHVLCSGDKHALKYLSFKYLGYDNIGEQELHDAVLRSRAAHKDWDLAKEGHPCFPGLSSPQSWYKMDYWTALDECRKYASEDTEMTWLLWKLFKETLEREELTDQYEMRKTLIKITYEMETKGIHFYEQEVKDGIQYCKSQKKQLIKQITDTYPFNVPFDITKQKHVQYLLFTAMELEPIEYSEKTGQPLVNKDVLSTLAAQNPDLEPLQWFQEYKTLDTQQNYFVSYLKWLDDNSRIHSNILITGTRETRQASRNPNIQNIGKKFRHVLGPPPGHIWLDYDLVNIELRIWVYQVKNQRLLDIFESGGSVHKTVASVLFPEEWKRCQDQGLDFAEEYKSTYYAWTKNGNFAIIYGASPYTVNRSYKHDDGYAIIGKEFPEVPLFAKRCEAEMLYNYSKFNSPFVTCLGGYRLEVDTRNPHKACNYKIQGSAGYLCNIAMKNIANHPAYEPPIIQMVNQVHDSFIIELPEEDYTDKLAQEFKTCIEDAGKELLPTCDATYEIKHHVPF